MPFFCKTLRFLVPLVASLVFVWIVPLCLNIFCFIVCCLRGGLLRKLVYPWVWWPLKVSVVLSRFCGTVYHDRWSPCELPLVLRGFEELVPLMMKFRKLVLFRASVPLGIWHIPYTRFDSKRLPKHATYDHARHGTQYMNRFGVCTCTFRLARLGGHLQRPQFTNCY